MQRLKNIEDNLNSNGDNGNGKVGIFQIIKDFLQIYNVFINKFDKFSEVMNKKQLGGRGPNQNELLDYRNELNKIIEKSFNPSGSGLKILMPQQMLARLPILLAQIKAGNNSRELKNEIRQLLYSLYRSKKISKIVIKNLIATI